MRFAVFFHVFMLSMKVSQFYCDFEFSLGFTVYSWHVGVRKTVPFGKSACPKPQRQPFFPVISTSSLSAHLFSPTGLFQLHLPPIATAMCERTSKWGHSILCSFSGQDVNWSGTLASTWTLLPHPTPPHPCVTWHIFNVAWCMCARASERAVA